MKPLATLLCLGLLAAFVAGCDTATNQEADTTTEPPVTDSAAGSGDVTPADPTTPATPNATRSAPNGAATQNSGQGSQAPGDSSAVREEPADELPKEQKKNE